MSVIQTWVCGSCKREWDEKESDELDEFPPSCPNCYMRMDTSSGKPDVRVVAQEIREMMVSEGDGTGDMSWFVDCLEYEEPVIQAGLKVLQEAKLIQPGENVEWVVVLPPPPEFLTLLAETVSPLKAAGLKTQPYDDYADFIEYEIALLPLWSQYSWHLKEKGEKAARKKQREDTELFYHRLIFREILEFHTEGVGTPWVCFLETLNNQYAGAGIGDEDDSKTWNLNPRDAYIAALENLENGFREKRDLHSSLIPGMGVACTMGEGLQAAAKLAGGIADVAEALANKETPHAPE